MSEVFEAKLRRIGNSLGIIIPGSVLEERGLSEGETVQVAVQPLNIEIRNKRLRALLGIDRGKPALKRDKKDRF